MSPTELENTLLFHDAVADAGVVGISDKEAGEVPYAWVQLKQGAELTEKQLQEWLAGERIVFIQLITYNFMKSIILNTFTELFQWDLSSHHNVCSVA